MKIILFVCLLFIGVNTAFAQYHKTKNLSTMIKTLGKAETIRTLDSVIQILFTNPIDTISKSEIWYSSLQPRFPVALISFIENGKELKYASIYLRAYYWMWLISTNNIPESPISSIKEKAMLVDEYDFGIFDYYPVRDSINQPSPMDNIFILRDTSTYRIFDVFKEIDLYFPLIKPAYTQWITIVKNEGLSAAQEMNISLLPKKYKWELL